MSDFVDPTAEPNDDWGAFFLRSRNRLLRRLDQFAEEGRLTQDAAIACRQIIASTAREVFERARAEGVTCQNLIAERIEETAALTLRIYDCLTPSWSDGAIPKARNVFWHHMTHKHGVALSKSANMNEPIDASMLRHEATIYLSKAWMQQTYLDWVFLDALIFNHLNALYHKVNWSRLGLFYGFFGDTPEAFLINLAAKATLFALGWLGPAGVGWLTYRDHPATTVYFLAIYYIANITWRLLVWGSLITVLVQTGKFPNRADADRLLAIQKAYQTLGGEAIHVPSLRQGIEAAQRAGIAWDPQVLCIAENVAVATPITWIPRLNDEWPYPTD